MDLGPEELGGVAFNGPSIIYAFKKPVAARAYTGATYTNISEKQFTWRGQRSDDGKTFIEAGKVMAADLGRLSGVAGVPTVACSAP